MSIHRYGTEIESDRGRKLDHSEVAELIAHHIDGPSKYIWYFNPAFPLSKLKSLVGGTGPLDDSPSGWIKWLGRERRQALEEEDREPWGQDFVHWWTTGCLHEEECPIIATEQRGGFGVEDGNHRVAVSHEYEMKTVPAYIGYRR